MKILAIDTSTSRFSVALSDGEKILAERNIVLTKVLENSIIPVIDSVLKKAKTPLAKLDGFAVGLGPGSFTSLRVGVSTIKAFCLATDKPVVGIPSLDIIAQGVNLPKGQVCVITDARRNLVYAAIYRKEGSRLKQISDYLLVPMDELLNKISQDTLFTGDAVDIFKNNIIERKNKFKSVFVSKSFWYPESRHLVQLSLKRFKENRIDNPHKLLPLYLYPEDCQVDKKEIRGN